MLAAPFMLTLALAAAAPSGAALSQARGGDTPAATQPAEASERPRLLVLELERGNMDAASASTVNALLTTITARTATGYDVVSSADMRRLMDMAATRESLDCDASGTSCLTELAAALGAERVVFGTLGQLGDTTIITLDLFDADAGTAVGRESLEVTSMDALPSALRKATAALFARDGAALVHRAKVPEREPVPAGIVWGTWGGLGVAALGFAGAGLVELDLQSRMRAEADYTAAQGMGVTALAVGAAGLVTAAVCGGLWAAHPSEEQ